MIFIVMLFLSSCVNKIEEVKEATKIDTGPLEMQENLSLEYSDSSYTRIKLDAVIAEHYTHLEEPYRLFPKGIKVKFFDELGVETSRLKANFAKELIDEQLWEGKGDVVVVNRKGEQLNTEKLFWNKKTEKIYSDAYVKITTDTQIIEGTGFEADQDFTNYTIENVIGIIYLEDEENN